VRVELIAHEPDPLGLGVDLVAELAHYRRELHAPPPR
jgi:hypothetical protein